MVSITPLEVLEIALFLMALTGRLPISGYT
jgi:hypothetical protein